MAITKLRIFDPFDDLYVGEVTFDGNTLTMKHKRGVFSIDKCKVSFHVAETKVWTGVISDTRAKIGFATRECDATV